MRLSRRFMRLLRLTPVLSIWNDFHRVSRRHENNFIWLYFEAAWAGESPKFDYLAKISTSEPATFSAKIFPISTRRKVRVMTSSHSAFTTRQNPDGSFDLICLHCFLTAGTTKNKSELLAIERRHQCDPHVLLMLDRSSDEETDEARRDEPQELQHPQ
jgi:hypothetical protein